MDFFSSTSYQTKGNLVFIKTSFHEDFEILDKILGSGLNGKVMKCVKKSSGEKFALKVLKDGDKSRCEIGFHWKASSCRHIVNLVCVYENQPSLYVVMECMKGGELFSKIKEKISFNEREAAEMMKDICLAVKFLHDLNIAHRDLKPENLLCSSHGDHIGELKLTDFGFAKEISSTTFLQTPCFTPYYVAPEILSSTRYDKSCDIWSLGVIMYILLCGYPPFHSKSNLPMSPGMKKRIRAGHYSFPVSEWNLVSTDAKELIREMLEIDPEKRLTIDEVIKNKWIAQYTNVPQTPLLTSKVLKEEDDQWADVQQDLSMALKEMRIEQNQSFTIKKPENSNSILAKKRQIKASGNNLPMASKN